MKSPESQTTANKTFRLSTSAIQLLEQEAHDKQESVNAVINELVLKNLKNERDLRGTTTFPVSIQTLRLLSEELSDEKISEIANKLLNDGVQREFYHHVIGTMTPEGVLQAMKRHYHLSETETGGRRILILSLYCGKKWSLLTGLIWQALLASAGLDVKLSTDDNSAMFEYATESVDKKQS